jgi:hypothetical protein
MDLSSLLDALNSIQDTNDIHTIIDKIILFLHEASEMGENSYTYYFENGEKRDLIIQKLLMHFPDINIITQEGANYIIIDWS